MLASIFLNRFSITLGVILTVSLIWNIYVEANNDGILTGQIVNQNGIPLANATVTASNKTLALPEAVGVATTDKNGRFKFDDLNEYALILTAKLDDHVTDSFNVQLWFKKQNTNLSQALVLNTEAEN